MGCGCGKNRNNRIARAAAKRKVALGERIAAAGKNRVEKTARRKLVQTKIKLCRACPYSIPTTDERRRKARVCHKANIALQAILNDKNFKCPIGNF